MAIFSLNCIMGMVLNDELAIGMAILILFQYILFAESVETNFNGGVHHIQTSFEGSIIFTRNEGIEMVPFAQLLDQLGQCATREEQ